MCKIKLNNQIFYILILFRILFRSTMFIMSNFVVGQAIWQQKMRTKEVITCHCFIQSHTAATASCDWGGHSASRLVAHPNRPGVIFTHTPQVRIWVFEWMMHVNMVIMILFFCHSLQIRSTYLKHRPKVKFLCGVWPMLHIESQKASWKGPEKRKMDQSQTSDRKRSSQWASAAAGSDQRLLVWFPCSPSCSVRQVH